jgi:hypothetical protein
LTCLFLVALAKRGLSIPEHDVYGGFGSWTLGLLDWSDDSALEEERPIGLKIQRSDGVEKPRPQSIYIFDPGIGWLMEHPHDHQYPAKEVVETQSLKAWGAVSLSLTNVATTFCNHSSGRNGVTSCEETDKPI